MENDSKPTLAVLILAAGKSSRMGGIKQLLKWGDTTLIEHTIATVEKLNQKEIVVVLGAYSKQITPKICNYPITIIDNPNWSQGLGGSIAFGVNYLKSLPISFDGVLVVLADQPFIKTDYLKLMQKDFRKGTKQIVATKYVDNKLGVPVIFNQSYFKALSALKNDKGAQVILQTFKEYISVCKAEITNLDIDTLDEYKRYQALRDN